MISLSELKEIDRVLMYARSKVLDNSVYERITKSIQVVEREIKLKQFERDYPRESNANQS